MIRHSRAWLVDVWLTLACAFGYRTAAQGVTLSLQDLGAIGDGEHLNTHIIEQAVAQIAAAGGGRLIVPRGAWVTAPFNVTSHMTLFLEAGATLVATRDKSLWPIVQALPTYGVGRDHAVPWRFGSFIHGDSVENVTITGDFGAIDGQGEGWWWLADEHNATRGHLIEFVNSKRVTISHVRLLNSPFWTVHPYFCEDVHVHDMEIWAPVPSPNTDGIDPDSSSDVVIENVRYHGGDDAVAIKSGWDCFGYDKRVARPSRNILVRNLTAFTTAAGVAIGSEMSGGVENVTVQDCHFGGGATGGGLIYLKASPTRGGYIRNVHMKDVTLSPLEKTPAGISIGESFGNANRGCATHPELPTPISDVFFERISQDPGSPPAPLAAKLIGRAASPVVGLHLRDIHLRNASDPGMSCAHLRDATAEDVTPPPCQAFSPGSAGLIFA